MKLFIETPENVANSEEDILRFAAEHFLYVVCWKKDATRLHQKAKKLGLDIPFPLSYRELLDKKYYGSGIEGIIVLDADMLLREICPTLNIAGISIRDKEAFSEFNRVPHKRGGSTHFSGASALTQPPKLHQTLTA